ATQNPVTGVTEVDADHTRGPRALDNWRVVRGPRIASVGGGNDPGFRCTAGADPSAPLALSSDTGTAGRESCFAVLRRGQIVSDILPELAVGGAQYGK